MYHLHWGLNESPFHPGLDPRYFYRSPMHDEALARLHFLVEAHRRVGWLAAETGCGKSLLCEVLAREVRQDGGVARRIPLAGVDGWELLWQISHAIGLCPPENASGHRLWRGIVDMLAANRFHRADTVLLLDDLDEASDEARTVLRRLVECDCEPGGRLTLVLTSEPGSDALGQSGLIDRVELKIEVPRWEPADSAEFVYASLRRAGQKDASAFTSEALAKLHEVAQGVPRRVAQVAELALLAGAGADLARITPETILVVASELAITADEPESIRA